MLQKEQEAPRAVKYPRNTDLDPQLVWLGKDEPDWSDLIVRSHAGEVGDDDSDGTACWFVGVDCDTENAFARHAFFLGASDPCSALKTTLKAEINPEPGQPSTATPPASSTSKDDDL